jgi:hypothetical protein
MDTVLGLLGLVFFCACVIVFAAAITWLVVRLTPARANKPEPSAD